MTINVSFSNVIRDAINGTRIKRAIDNVAAAVSEAKDNAVNAISDVKDNAISMIDSTIGKCIHKDEIQIYERSGDYYLTLTRDLSSDEWKSVDERHKKGERYESIFSSMGILK